MEKTELVNSDNDILFKDLCWKLTREDQKKLIKALSDVSDSRQRLVGKINEWIELLNLIPSVKSAYACKDEDFINIGVYSNVGEFIHKPNDKNAALFVLRSNGVVERAALRKEITDVTFNSWYKTSYKDIYNFYKALIDLCHNYEKDFLAP